MSDWDYLSRTRPKTSSIHGGNRQSNDSLSRQQDRLTTTTYTHSPSVKAGTSRTSGTSTVKSPDGKNRVSSSYKSTSTGVTDQKGTSASSRSPSVKPSTYRSPGTSVVKNQDVKDRVPSYSTSTRTSVTDQKSTSTHHRSPSVGTRNSLSSSSSYTYYVPYKSGDEVMYQKKARATFLGTVKGSSYECTIVTQDGMIMWVPKSDLEKVD